MKVAVLGASGWIGSQLVLEAKQRGHQVIALVRDIAKCDVAGVEVRQFDLQDSDQDLFKAVQGADVVIASIGGRAAGNHDIVPATATRLLNTLANTEIKRLLWVGGAGSLEVAPGIKLVTTAQFPAEYKDEALAQSDALEVFKGFDGGLNWTFVSPAAELFPGEKQQAYRIGNDTLLTDAQGNSRISVADYALAMIDELEANQHPNQRIGVAY